MQTVAARFDREEKSRISIGNKRGSEPAAGGGALLASVPLSTPAPQRHLQTGLQKEALSAAAGLATCKENNFGAR